MTQDTVSTSKFYMFRCMIAIAHADGDFHEAERAYMYALMNHTAVPLSKEQYATLESDMATPQDIGDLLRHINEPKFRSQVIYFARLMAYKDGVLDASEEQILEKMRVNAMSGIDVEGLREEVRTAKIQEQILRDIEIAELRPKGGLFYIFDQILLALGIDLMRD